MDIQIVIRGVDDDTNLRRFAEEKIDKALERFEKYIINVTVRLEDVTGPDKGGVDKQCGIEVKLRMGEVRIKERGEDFKATTNIALDRLKVAMGRETAKAKRGIGEG